MNRSMRSKRHWAWSVTGKGPHNKSHSGNGSQDISYSGFSNLDENEWSIENSPYSGTGKNSPWMSGSGRAPSLTRSRSGS